MDIYCDQVLQKIITSSICIVTRFNICTEAFQELFDKSEWVHKHFTSMEEAIRSIQFQTT